MTVLVVTEKQFKNNKKDDYIVASLFRHEWWNDCEANIKYELLENEEHLPTEKVYAVIDEINDCLDECKFKYDWIYKQEYHIEGAGISQNISDLVLLQHIYVQIFEKYPVDKVILNVGNQNITECLVANQMASNRNIKCVIRYESMVSYAKSMLAPMAKRILKIGLILKNESLFIKLFIKSKNKFPGIDRNYNVGICISSDVPKHYYWVEDLLKQVKETFSDSYVVCAGTKGVYNRAIKDGFVSERTDEWIDKTNVIEFWKEYHKGIHIYKKIASKTWYIEGEDFSPYIRRQLLLEVYNRVVFYFSRCIVVKSYLKHHHFRYLKAYSECFNIETRALSYFSKREDTKVFNVTHVLQQVQIDEKYKYCNCIDVRYTFENDCDIKKLIHSGYTGIINTVKRDYYTCKFKTPQTKCDNYDISLNKINILWAPSYPLRGYSSTATFIDNNRIVIENSLKRKNVNLVIKFHPNQNEYEINNLKKKYPQIIVVDKGIPIRQLIKSADLVLTDASTLIYDCFSLTKPVVAIDEQALSYLLNDLIGYVTCYTGRDFWRVFDEKMENKNLISDWINEMTKMQNMYMKSNGCKITIEKYVVDDIKKELQK